MIIGQYYISFTKHAKLPWNRLKVSKHYPRIGKPYAYSFGWGRFSLWIERDLCGCRWTEDCQDCCEHGDYDHGICGICGKDCLDDLIGAAEYYYEGDR